MGSPKLSGGLGHGRWPAGYKSHREGSRLWPPMRRPFLGRLRGCLLERLRRGLAGNAHSACSRSAPQACLQPRNWAYSPEPTPALIRVHPGLWCQKHMFAFSLCWAHQEEERPWGARIRRLKIFNPVTSSVPKVQYLREEAKMAKKLKPGLWG